MLGNLKWLLVVALLVPLLAGLFGCGEMTRDQVEVQKEQLQSFTDFAQANALSMFVVANADVDGTFEMREVVKWSPVTGDVTALFFNQAAVGAMRDLINQLQQDTDTEQAEGDTTAASAAGGRQPVHVGSYIDVQQPRPANKIDRMNSTTAPATARTACREVDMVLAASAAGG